MIPMMLSGSGGGGGMPYKPLAYIGSVNKDADTIQNMDSAGEAVDVMSIASVYDLVVIALTFDSGYAELGTEWTWGGMEFTTMELTTSTSPGMYVGYHFVQPGDSNPYMINIAAGASDFSAMSVVALVFQGVSAFLRSSIRNGSSGTPDPPPITLAAEDGDADLWIISGHLDDDAVGMGSDADFTGFSNSVDVSSSSKSSTNLAYRISTRGSIVPDPYSGSGDDGWRATTSCFYDMEA